MTAGTVNVRTGEARIKWDLYASAAVFFSTEIFKCVISFVRVAVFEWIYKPLRRFFISQVLLAGAAARTRCSPRRMFYSVARCLSARIFSMAVILTQQVRTFMALCSSSSEGKVGASLIFAS